jgi:hypothetical protein
LIAASATSQISTVPFEQSLALVRALIVQQANFKEPLKNNLYNRSVEKRGKTGPVRDGPIASLMAPKPPHLVFITFG